MKTIELTRGMVALVDDEDYEELSRYKWRAVKKPSNNSWYALRDVKRNGKWTTEEMQRTIMKPGKHQQVDHIDHDGLNNQKSNLRVCTNADNSRNRLKGKNKSFHSCFKGAYIPNRLKRKPTWILNWASCIHFEGKTIHLGTFATEIEAALAYDAAARKYFGEFALTNFPLDPMKETYESHSSMALSQR